MRLARREHTSSTCPGGLRQPAIGKLALLVATMAPFACAHRTQESPGRVPHGVQEHEPHAAAGARIEPATGAAPRPASSGAEGSDTLRAEPPARRPPATVSLSVDGFEPALVSFPATAPLPQPVLISTHGAGDTPEQMCELWRAILGDRGVVLCPAGPRMRAHEEGRYYPDHHALERIVFTSLGALVARYAGYVDPARVVYTGYSQGATMGALMIPAHGGECPRLVLVEGGFGDWSVERASTFAEGGGQRVLFVCGRQQCKNDAERSAAWLRSAGVEARVVAHVGEGHVIRVALVAGPSLEWLLGDDARWTPRRQAE